MLLDVGCYTGANGCLQCRKYIYMCIYIYRERELYVYIYILQLL